MQIETVSLTTDLEQAYFQYAVETITDRALPRVEDGLKPVQRRILYAMHDMGLHHDKPHRKSARVVGECLGKYHPHGDQSVYLAMVRMGQDFAMRHPLIDGQGNFGCFTGDTKVKLLNGTDRTFEELAQMYGPDEIFYVYSVDNDGNIVVGEGRYSRVTRQKAKVIELELDNGEIIRCTPDHRFMLHDGSYKPAQDLTEHDSLMAGYFSTAPDGNVSIAKGPFVRHHKDFNRWNNNPANIERMGFMEHLRLSPEERERVAQIISEKSRAMWQDETKRAAIVQAIRLAFESPELRAKLSERTQALWQDPEYRAKFADDHFSQMSQAFWEQDGARELHRQKIWKQWEDEDFRVKQRQGVQASNARRLADNPEMMRQLAEQSAESLRQKWQDEGYKRQVMRSKILHYGSYLLSRFEAEEITPELYDRMRYNNCFPRFEKAMTYFDSFDEFLALAKTYNHRVVAKRVLTKRFDVYDITVEPYHNFLLSSGVFVHNSIDGDPPAAMRYTEARLAEIAEHMLQDIDQDTVDFVDNFDGSLQEPVILPSALPNLLVNGATGIAVGMATNIPPHNLGEVCGAVVTVAERWRERGKISVDELMEIIPGPDFPTGGVIYRYREDPAGTGKVDTIRAAYETGRGRIVTQARMDMEDIGGGKVNIVVTELPYAVQKSTVLERIAREVREGRINGVTDLRDESDHEGMRAIIEVSRMADAREVLESVLSHSQLRETFGVNALALVAEQVNGEVIVRPQRLSLLNMLIYFVGHRLTVIARRSRYELEKRQARLHIVEGLLKALDVIDAVIETIRRSRTSETAERNLIKTFQFTPLQAQAILAMQLRRLAALERRKLADEEKELQARITYLKGLLRSEKRRLEVVVEETQAIKEKFATPRKTVILTDEKPGDSAVTEAELAVPEEPQMVVVTTRGVQRDDVSRFGYRVKAGITSRAVEAHRMHLRTEPQDTIVLVSSRGRAWWGTVGRLPRSARFEELGLSKEEQVVGVGVLADRCCLVVGTRRGQVKRVKAEDVTSTAEASWAMVVGLADEEDEVLFAGVGGDDAQVLFFGTGRANRFVAGEVNPQATPSARGVAGIKVRQGDRLLGGALIGDPAADLGVVVVSEKGYVKRVPLSEFPVQSRGGQGVLLLTQTEATGPVIAATVGPMDGSVDLISADEKRQRLDEVPVTNRANRGEKLVELDEVVEVRVLL